MTKDQEAQFAVLLFHYAQQYDEHWNSGKGDLAGAQAAIGRFIETLIDDSFGCGYECGANASAGQA